MKYGFQVYVRDRASDDPNRHIWLWVSPPGGKPYQYTTWAEAENMARLCYGTDPGVVRVRIFPGGGSYPDQTEPRQ